MITDPGGLTAASENPARQPTAQILVDWGSGPEDITAHVGAVTISRQITGDLPEEVATSEGSSVAELTAVLTVGDVDDASVHAAGLFSRYNTAAPLYGVERLGCEVSATVGMTVAGVPVLVPRFTGVVTELPVSSTDRTATLTALDNRELLRRNVTLPATAADYGPGTVVKPGLNAQWIADLIYRRNGYATSPLRPDTATSTTVLSATMHGSAYPDTGTLVEASRWDTVGNEFEPCTFTTGEFGYALAGPDGSGLTPDAYNYALYKLTRQQPLPLVVWSVLHVELWLSAVPGTLTGVTPLTLFNLHNSVDPDIITLELRHNGVNRVLRAAYSRGSSGAAFMDVTFTATALVEVLIQKTTTGRTIWIRQDGAQVGGAAADAASIVDTGDMDRIRINALGALEGVVITYSEQGSNTIPATSFGHTSEVELGESRNDLVAVLASEARDSWELLREVAAAEFAWVGFDEETGQPFYRTTEYWGQPEQQTVAATITAERDLLQLANADAMDRIRNQVTVPVRALSVSAFTDVWTGTPYLRARQTRLFFADFDDPVLDLDTNIQAVQGSTPGPGTSRILANSRKDGTGVDLSTYLTATVVFWTASRALVRVTNRSPAYGAYVADSAGGPGLFLAGTRVLGNDNALSMYAEDVDSITEFGDRPLDLPASPWRQDPAVAQGIADGLLARLKDPHPVPVGVSIVGNPLLVLGDRVRLQDPGGTELDDEYWVTGITDRLSPDGGYTQDLDVREAWTGGNWDEFNWDDGTAWGI